MKPRKIIVKNITNLTPDIILNIITLPNSVIPILLFLLSKGIEEKTFFLSSKELCEKCKISRPTYSNGFKVLIESNYLIPTKNKEEYILTLGGENIGR